MISPRMLRQTITVSRLTKTVGIVKEQTVIATGVRALITSADSDATTDYGISVGMGWNIYVSSPFVFKVSDTITDNRGRVFIVKGVTEYDDFDRVSYVNAMCDMIGRTGENNG